MNENRAGRASGIDTPITRLLHEAVRVGFRSTADTDLVIRCSMRESRDFHCHKSIVLRQVPSLSDTYGIHLDENLGCDIITIDSWDHIYVLPMLQFIYTGSYNCHWALMGDIGGVFTAGFHIVVYGFASAINFQELKQLSDAKFTFQVHHHLSPEGFLLAPGLCLAGVYHTCVDPDRGLKDAILAFCSLHAEELMGNQSFYCDRRIPEEFWKEFAWYLAGCP
ncbi:BTB/POZ domain containing protein [Lasiodiplodia theobromae]|uniref:BTB/POZ domain containing protein n=1 Tax=Lasiodiplodia theobromae TaxID=45133 RepID=UPI0015C39150|nr:BTB/POZ domain containing protein [Lasiodiplodia theobromae]KAF4541510.1 BTB/POZ domain containing protein [Lasiodiplodia theobromae]